MTTVSQQAEQGGNMYFLHVEFHHDFTFHPQQGKQHMASGLIPVLISVWNAKLERKAKRMMKKKKKPLRF